jgi:hypothetical protein
MNEINANERIQGFQNKPDALKNGGSVFEEAKTEPP